jgi:uncharacterized protein (DUF1778 family)
LQIKAFREAARELDAHESEERLDAALLRPAQRPNRINLRLSRQAKRRLEQAAAYSEKTLTDFVLDAALEKADSIPEQQDVITLTGEEWERFQALLHNPACTE